jgi:hypothetical protein
MPIASYWCVLSKQGFKKRLVPERFWMMAVRDAPVYYREEEGEQRFSAPIFTITVGKR